MQSLLSKILTHPLSAARPILSPSPSKRSLRIVLIGPPAGGKGTLAEWVSGDFGLPTLSTGVILQQIARRSDLVGERMRAFLASGNLMGDDEITDYLFSTLPNSGGWLVDGYPRTVEQARRLDARLGDTAPLDVAVFLEISKEAVRERVLGRWVHLASGRVYSYEFDPPQREGADDVTGEPLVRRLDDNYNVFDKRWANYELHKQSLLRYYQEKGIATVIRGSTSPVLYAQLRTRLEGISLQINDIQTA